MHIQRVWDTINGARFIISSTVASPLDVSATPRVASGRPTRQKSKKNTVDEKRVDAFEFVQPAGKPPPKKGKTAKLRFLPYIAKKLKTERGSKVVEVAGDGDCFFHALRATAPELFESISHVDLRAVLCSYLEENKGYTVLHDEHDAFTFEALFFRNKDAFTYEERINQLKKSGEYADILMIYAAANYYHVDIEVYDTTTNTFEMQKCITGGKRHVLLVRQSQPDHYWGTTAIPSKKKKNRKETKREIE
jgi:hypothetical protein